MATGIFNVALGRVNALHDRVVDNDPANSAITIVLLKVVEVDATLEDYATLDALLVAAGNTEADFTNYARIELTDATLVSTVVDNGANKRSADAPDQTWTTAGGAANNTLVKVIICYDDDTTTGTDANIVPLTHYDFAVTTDGTDLITQFHVDGYYEATG